MNPFSQIPDPPEKGSTSVRLGPAFLRPATEKDHYELMRRVITVTNEGDKITKSEHPDPVGPLAVYRIKRKGDAVSYVGLSTIMGPPKEMKTSDPKTGQPMTLTLVWWPGEGQEEP